MFLPRLSAFAGPSKMLLRSALGPCARPCTRPALPTPLALARLSFGNMATLTTLRGNAPAATRLGLGSPTLSLPLKRTYATDKPRPPRMSEHTWPWHAVENPPSPNVDEIERVIYARPGYSEPKIFWALFIVWAFGMITWLVLPSANEAIARGIKPSKERTYLGMPEAAFWTYLTSGAVTVLTVFALFALAFPSRMVTRLSLVQQKPRGADGPVSTFLRMRTSGHDMVVGRWGRARELPLSAVDVNMILGRQNLSGERDRNPWLRVTVKEPNASTFTKLWDRIPYRLDFRETPDLNKVKGELVLSPARIEDVFGKLTPRS